MKKKNVTAILMAGLMLVSAGCNKTTGDATGTTPPTNPETKPMAASGEISVVSREDGSGTRGAFIELFGIEEKGADGKKVDNTTLDAAITNNTSVMMTTIAGDKNAIGYISLGSLNDTVKALKIDGAEATAANIESGSYKVSRPFNIATKADLSDAAKDFVSFIMSDEGQAVVTKTGYIPTKSNGAYKSSGATGKVTIGGSSSVTPLMEKLKEAYTAVNASAELEIQQSDSTTGMNNAADGVCDIGMASRALKDSETAKGLQPTVIATDGIAVIVNKENATENMAAAQVKDIFTGTVTEWENVK